VPARIVEGALLGLNLRDENVERDRGYRVAELYRAFLNIGEQRCKSFTWRLLKLGEQESQFRPKQFFRVSVSRRNIPCLSQVLNGKIWPAILQLDNALSDE
jgi:hypothetical protein